MKKLTVMTIVLALLLAVASVVCAAEAQPETENVKTVTFNLGETAARTGRYTVTYSSEYLEYVKGSATPSTAENADKAGEVVVAFSGANATEITLKFKVIKEEAGKEVEVTLTPDKFVSTEGEKMTTLEAKAEKVKVGEEVKKYTVTFKDYDGKVLKTETVEEGKGATAPAEPTREGYKFVGWDKDFAEVRGDLEVTAKYEEVKENTGDDNKGDEDNKGGETDQKPAEPTKPSTSDDDEMDQTGMNMLYVGIIALVVIAGAVVLIKRK